MENLKIKIIELIKSIEKMIERDDEKEKIELLRKELDVLLKKYLKDL